MKVDIVQCHRMQGRHVEPRELRFAEYLHERGFEVSIYTMTAEPLRAPLREVRNGVNCIYYGLRGIEKNNSEQTCDELKFDLLKNKANITLYKGLGYKVIEDTVRLVKEHSKTGIIIGGKVVHQSLSLFDFIFIESFSQEKTILEKYPNLNSKFIFLPKLIDWRSVERFREESKRYDICNVGQFIPRKNQAALIPLFDKYEVVFIGGGPELGNFKSSAVGRSNVFFAGQLDRTDVYRFVSSSRLNVHTSLHEGLPRAAVEGFACGVPLVAFDTTLGDVFNDLSFVYLSSENKFLGVIDDLLANREVLSELSESARNWAFEMFGPHRLMETVEAFIDFT